MSSDAESDRNLLTTNRKALLINLDQTRYGTFAEIGAGQEVARHFFQAGGASGTVAKTMSAYDMGFSDAIYGKTRRYVSRERLETMLDHEYELLLDRLTATRGDRSRFFVFADTVAARSYRGDNECHGWLGLRFQTHPGADASEIIAHVRMWDKENIMQQQAIGVFGVNLAYGAFEFSDDPLKLVRSLVDNVGADRIEVDYLDTSGPAFAGVDNRELALLLVQEGLTNGVMFSPDGRAVVTGEALYKKAVLVQRGSFRPVTRVNEDLMACALRQFSREESVAGKSVVPLYEISLTKSRAAGNRDSMKLLDRVDTLNAIGGHVLVSNYLQYFRLTAHVRRYTSEMVGYAMGARALQALLDESHYEQLDGGILEAMGRLFKSNVHLYVYPRLQEGPNGPELLTATNLPLPRHLAHIHAYLLDRELLRPIDDYDESVLSILAREARESIRAGDNHWEAMVPEPAARIVRERKLFTGN